MSVGDLFVSFLGQVTQLDHSMSLTFGRSGDLVVDDNPFLHRIAGRLSAQTGSWTLENVGSKIVLSLRGEGQVVATSVPPGQRVRLIDDRWSIQFAAGPTRYQIEGWFARPVVDERQVEISTEGATQHYGQVDLTADQRLVAVAMCQQFLRGDFESMVPANKEIAAELRWTNKSVQRQIDNLVEKLTAAGVRGLKSTDGTPVQGRRDRLARHLIVERVVTPDDLGLLEPDD